MLPYFAGERTPIMDPDARGVIAGLTLSHTRGDLYRAALEATGYAVRHNIEAIEAAGGDIRRIVAVGGGTQGGLWTQIVSDVTGREQEIRAQSIGASYGAALLAAELVASVSIDAWNPVQETVTPRPEAGRAVRRALRALPRPLSAHRRHRPRAGRAAGAVTEYAMPDVRRRGRGAARRLHRRQRRPAAPRRT